MQKLSILLLFLFITTISYSQKGIDFTSKSWLKVLDKAATEGKPIFIDAYTTWCGPCKWMDKNVFDNSAVGTYYNSNFINVKYDMEESDGQGIGNTYGVNSYPTFLFISPDGKELHRAFGARDVQDFVSLGEVALSPDKRLSYFESNYASQRTDSKFLMDYASALDESGQTKKMDIAKEYLDTQSDWLTKVNIPFIFHYTGYEMESEFFKFVINNKQAFYQELGESKVDDKIVNGIIASMGPGATMDELELKVTNIYGDKAQRYIDYLKLEEMLNSKSLNDPDQFIGFVNHYFTTYQVIGWETLNNMAWRVYEIGTTEYDLKVALKIIDKSVTQNNNYFNNDTLAAILYKLGYKEDAKHFATEAIKLAKASGEDPSSTYNLLDLIDKLD